jgi:hypothetical protein
MGPLFGMDIMDTTIYNEQRRSDEESSRIVPTGFPNLILCYYFSKKGVISLNVTMIAHSPGSIPIEVFRPSAKVLSSVIEFLGHRLESDTDNQFELDSTSLMSILIQQLKKVICQKNDIELKAPNPLNIERYIEKHA